MNVYTETEGGSFVVTAYPDNLAFVGASIPLANGNRDYRAMLQQVIDLEATITPYAAAIITETDQLVLDTDREKGWVREQLAASEREVLFHSDGSPYKQGQRLDWKDYRNGLRAWPEHANFPEIMYRPQIVLRDINGNIIDYTPFKLWYE